MKRAEPSSGCGPSGPFPGEERAEGAGPPDRASDDVRDGGARAADRAADPALVRRRLMDGTYLTEEMAERVAERLVESGDLDL